MFATMLCMIFLVGTVSAFEFDNVKSYDADKAEYLVENVFGLGKDLLRSHRITPHELTVWGSYNVPIAEYDIRLYDDYDNLWGEVELYTIDSEDELHELNRGYHREYGVEEEYDALVYETRCDEKILDEYGTPDQNHCYNELVRNTTETRLKWQHVTPDMYETMSAGNYTIRIVLDETIPGEKGEWIENVAGERFEAWSIWNTDGLNIDLITNYEFNQSSGGPIDIANGSHNGSLYNTAGYIGGGIIGNATGIFSGSGNEGINVSVSTATDTPMYRDTGYTWELWINASDSNGVVLSSGNYGDDNPVMQWDRDPGAQMRLFQRGNGGSPQIFPISTQKVFGPGQWIQVIFADNGSVTGMWINGTFDPTNFNHTSMTGDLTLNNNFIGCVKSAGQDCAADKEGMFDNFRFWNRSILDDADKGASFVEALYNNHSSLTQVHSGGSSADIEPNVTQIAPVNGANFSISTVNFNYTAEDEQNVTNTTLYIDGEINTTTIHGTSNITNELINLNFSEGNHTWFVAAMDNSSLQFNSTIWEFTVDTTAPVVTIIFPVAGSLGYTDGSTPLNYTVIEDNTFDTCYYLFNNTNHTVTCGVNSTLTFDADANLSVTVYANDTFGNSANSNVNFTYVIYEESTTHNTSAFETDRESFSANITYDSSVYTSATAQLYYAGTGASASSSSAANNRLFSRLQDTPVGVTSNNFLWAFTLTNTTATEQLNSSTFSQSVSAINLTICGAAPQDAPYINFTFVNETTLQENTTATIVSTWEYFLGTGTVNKSLTYSNGFENSSYAFCFSPTNKSVSVTLNLDYNNAESQQRTFALVSSLLTNVTTDQILYLLPTSVGIFTRYRTIDTVGNVVTGVLAVVSKIIGGVSVQVTSDTTDSSGQVIFFLNPDDTYSYIFSKSGFTNNEFSLQPNSVETYTVTMTRLGETNLTGSTIALNTSYNIIPANNSLLNETVYTFGFNVTSSQTISLISMNISNGTEQYLYTSSSGAGLITGALNTGTNSSFVGEFIIQTANETLTVKKIWNIDDYYTGAYSLKRQLRFVIDYEFSDFNRMFMAIFFILAIIIYMSAAQVPGDDEMKILVVILSVWIFSVVGWFNTGLAVNTASAQINAMSQFSSQYGIAILTSVAGIFFLFRRVFR